MNFLFTFIFLLSCFLLLVTNPNGFLSALLDGGKQGASLCLALLSTYAVWMGLMHVWEESGVSKALSRFLKPIAKKLFKTEDEETLSAVCMNLSVNLLGISGAATPYGIKVANLLDRSEYPEYASALFFVLNATSIQLLPTSIIAVRTSLGSINPTYIVLPTLLASLFSTVLGIVLIRIFVPPEKSPFPNEKARAGAR